VAVQPGVPWQHGRMLPSCRLQPWTVVLLSVPWYSSTALKTRAQARYLELWCTLPPRHLAHSASRTGELTCPYP
jgi:hypothetical protein